jgi:predicted DNA-binding transcriptional regulator YafY
MIMRGGRRVEVELLFSKKAAAWVKDKSWHPSQEFQLLKDGALKMTLRVADNEELVGWILSFGGEVQVVRPAPVKQRVLGEARKVLRSSS